jgi:hypothetical protein
VAGAKRNVAGKRRAANSTSHRSGVRKQQPSEPDALTAPRVDRARAIADAMPLVHYPANARVPEWSSWRQLESRSQRGLPPAPGPFGELRNNHVFVYGGPCCYHHANCIGDAVIYFARGAEDGRSGGATPFDSGSLEDSPPRLQPFRNRNATEDTRWRFFERHQVRLEGWRDHFAAWLAHCYDDPNRYLESVADRHAAGQPDRTIPGYLLAHNGMRGRENYGIANCGDRRAWTWEVRIESTLTFKDVALLHVPFDAIEHASNMIEDIEPSAGPKPRIRPLPRNVVASMETLYEESGAILQELVGS